FRAVLRTAGVKCLKLPARSANLNAIAERFVLSLKSECLSKLVPLGERHLRLAISEFVEHYHLERNHQGLDNRLITTVAVVANENADPAAPVARRERLGGILNYYYRRAASPPTIGGEFPRPCRTVPAPQYGRSTPPTIREAYAAGPDP